MNTDENLVKADLECFFQKCPFENWGYCTKSDIIECPHGKELI